MTNLGDYGFGGRIVVVLIVLAFIVIVRFLGKRRQRPSDNNFSGDGGVGFDLHADAPSDSGAMGHGSDGGHSGGDGGGGGH